MTFLNSSELLNFEYIKIKIENNSFQYESSLHIPAGDDDALWNYFYPNKKDIKPFRDIY